MENKNPKKELIASFNCRLPIDLNKRLEAHAEAEKRTKNSQIQWILEIYLEQQDSKQVTQSTAQTS